MRLGLNKIGGSRIFKGAFADESKPFLDADYQDDATLSFDEFMARTEKFEPFRDRLVYSFDIESPASL